MIRFYAPDIAVTYTLPEVESGHCCRVLRRKEGDTLHAVDGKGMAYECRIVDANPKSTKVEIINSLAEPLYWSNQITLAIAPTKNIDRMEWLVEKAIEVGVNRIVFLKCDHSERKDVKIERILKIAVSAMKQSMKAVMPEIPEMMKFKDFIQNAPAGAKFMGYCSDEFERKNFINEYVPGQDVTILIGPEGDFSPAEVQMAVDAGFVPVTLGEMRLRTETAALYALSATQTLNQLKKV